jgi:hypothetical protein
VYWWNIRAAKRNGGAGGGQFLERLLALGWVAGMRFIAFAVLAMALFFGLVVALYPAVWEAIEEWADFIFLLGTPLFYAYLGRHVGDLARGKEAA